MERVNNIYLVVECPFEERDFLRFGFSECKNFGFEPHVLDLTPILNRRRFESAKENNQIKSFKGYQPFFDKFSAIQSLESLSENDIVIDQLGILSDRLPFKSALTRSKAKLVSLALSSVPQSFFCSPKVKNSKITLRKIKEKILKILRKLHFFLSGAYCRVSRLRSNDILFVAGEAPLIFGGDVSAKKVYKVISTDFQNYLSELKRELQLRKSYIVYLDEMTPSHPDWAQLQLTPSCKPEDFYPRIRQFFDRIEKVTGKKVIIAAHPRAKYQSGCELFGDREIIFGQTGSLVRSADIVLVHSSTSVSYAVLFNKPLIFLNNKIFSKYSDYDNFYIETMAYSLRKNTLDLEANITEAMISEYSNIDLEAYGEYRRNYLRSDDVAEEPLWPTIFRKLKMSINSAIEY